MKDSVISSLTERLAGEEKKKPCSDTDKASSRSFGKILEEKTASEEETKSMEPSKKSQEKEKEQVRAQLEKRISGKTFEMTPLHKLLYVLCYKDPSTLSLSEKKMLGLSDKDSGKVGYHDLHKMLKERGLSIGDLSWKDLSGMAKLEKREGLERFLDALAREREYLAGSDKKDAGELMLRNLQLIARETPALFPFALYGTEKTKASLERQVPQPRDEIIQQILHRIEWRNLDKGSEVFIQMNPEFLGPLNVKMLVEKDRVVASFKAESAQVRETIEENLDELKSALAKQGFDATEIRVGKL